MRRTVSSPTWRVTTCSGICNVLVQRESEFSGSPLRDNLVANHERLLRLSLPIFCASLPGFRELPFTVCQYLRCLACQLVGWSNVADRAVQAVLVVIVDVVRYQTPSLVEVERRLRANALGLQSYATACAKMTNAASRPVKPFARPPAVA